MPMQSDIVRRTYPETAGKVPFNAGRSDPGTDHTGLLDRPVCKYLGIEEFAAEKGFPFDDTVEDFAFFG